MSNSLADGAFLGHRIANCRSFGVWHSWYVLARKCFSVADREARQCIKSVVGNRWCAYSFPAFIASPLVHGYPAPRFKWHLRTK